MKRYYATLFCLAILLINLKGTGKSVSPVSKNASPEAKALLELFYDISGKYIFTGQHNYPNIKGRNTNFAKEFTGKTPVIYSTDWGFAKPGDTDSHLARPDIVEEGRSLHKSGAIITICWHAVPPTTNEPVTFRAPAGYTSVDSLISVQGQLTDKQFEDLLTPGTKIYNRWCSQVDTIAFYLKQLQDAHVPILWRPYHEMNGKWFWWGGRTGKYSTVALYKQLFDRLVNYHKINNLVWIWSVDRFHGPDMYYSKFFPGNKYMDILAVDIYGNDFNKLYYDSLTALSKGKPIVLGEVGNPPSLEVLNNQPFYAYYVLWAGMVRNTTRNKYKKLYANERVLNQEDSTYQSVTAKYRVKCNLPVLSGNNMSESSPVDFSGEWILDEDKSSLGNAGASSLPYKIVVTQKGQEIKLQKTFIPEYAENRIVDELLKTNGEETKSEMMNAPRTTKTRWSHNNDTLIVESVIRFNPGDNRSEMINNENWNLEGDNVLTINQYSKGFWGERKSRMVFTRCGNYKF